MGTSYKDSTHNALLKDYMKNGAKHVYALAEAMLRSSVHKGEEEFRTALHGEICEAVLEVALADYIKRNAKNTKDWFIKKGLILRDPTAVNSDYLTELDLTLFTPNCIYLFECKSYSGDKIIEEKCTLRTTKKAFDVYTQNAAHEETLLKNICELKVKGETAYKSKGTQKVLFSFSIGDLQDTRSASAKNDMPCLQLSDLDAFLSKRASSEKIWNMPAVRKAADVMETKSKGLRAKHLAYVKRVRSEK